MTLAQLRAEVKSRLNGPGYRFLSDTRVDRFINQARSELDLMHLWPYREKSTTGTAPLVISDLGDIEAVIDTTQDIPLTAISYRELLDIYGDLSTAGIPAYYYRARPSSPEIATYPSSSTDVIGVQYWKVTTDLALDADEPAAPSEYHGLIADMATAIALRANRLFSEAEAYQPAIERGITRMLISLKPGIADHSGDFQGVDSQDY